MPLSCYFQEWKQLTFHEWELELELKYFANEVPVWLLLLYDCYELDPLLLFLYYCFEKPCFEQNIIGDISEFGKLQYLVNY